MDNNATGPADAPADWLDSLARSDVDLEAGRVTDGSQVRQRLRDSIARMEAQPVLETPPYR